MNAISQVGRTDFICGPGRDTKCTCIINNTDFVTSKNAKNAKEVHTLTRFEFFALFAANYFYLSISMCGQGRHFVEEECFHAARLFVLFLYHLTTLHLFVHFAAFVANISWLFQPVSAPALPPWIRASCSSFRPASFSFSSDDSK